MKLKVLCVDENEDRVLVATNNTFLRMCTLLQIASCCALVRTSHFHFYRHLVFIYQEPLTLVNTPYTTGFIPDTQLQSTQASHNSTLYSLWCPEVGKFCE
jgi:hypothetical protein